LLRTDERPILRFETLLQCFEKSLEGSSLALLEPFKLIQEPNFYHIFLANNLKKGNHVITTNFDNLIETALNLSKNRILYSDEHFNQFEMNSLIESGYLLKLHGSLVDIYGNDTKQTIISTLDKLSLGLLPSKQNVLKMLLKNKILVFIGYSFSDYFDIMPFLRNLKHKSVIVFNYGEDSINKVEKLENYNGLEGDIQVLHGNPLQFFQDSFFELKCEHKINKNSSSDKEYIYKVKEYLNLIPPIFRIKVLANVFEVLGYAKKCLEVINATGNQYVDYSDKFNYSLLLIQRANANTELARTKKSINLLKLVKLNLAHSENLNSKLLYAKAILLMARDYRRQWSFKKAEKLFSLLDKCLDEFDEYKNDRNAREEILDLLFSKNVYNAELFICKSEQLYLPLMEFVKFKIFQRKSYCYLNKAKDLQSIAKEIISNYISNLEMTSLLLYKINEKKISYLLEGKTITFEDESRGYLESENIAGTIIANVFQAQLDYKKGKKDDAIKNLNEALLMAKEIEYPDIFFKTSLVLLEILYIDKKIGEATIVLLNAWKAWSFSYSISKYKIACLILLFIKTFSYFKLILGLKYE